MITDITNDYKRDPHDDGFARRTVERMSKHYKRDETTAERQKLVDPTGLSSLQTTLSILKANLIGLNIRDKSWEAAFEKIKTDYPAWVQQLTEFNAKPLAEMEKLRLRWKRFGPVVEWQKPITKAQLIPRGLKDLRLDREDASLLKQSQLNRINKKLAEAPLKVGGDKFLQKILPGLVSDKFEDLLLALLLATGRRTAEILSSGEFVGNNKDIPLALFTGQLKGGLKERKGYEIPLLAKLGTVQTAVDKLRLLIPKNLTWAELHKRYAMNISNLVKRRLGKEFTAHRLRTIYAIMCEKAYNIDGPQKASFIGYISRILGHDNLTVGVHYQRCEIIDLDCQKLPFV